MQSIFIVIFDGTVGKCSEIKFENWHSFKKNCKVVPCKDCKPLISQTHTHTQTHINAHTHTYTYPLPEEVLFEIYWARDQCKKGKKLSTVERIKHWVYGNIDGAIQKISLE